jgi:prepilin-type N-terminal cleavage/methylation domain-containing protein/prepilin-type processing-associated H-X9-DG protein
LKIGLIKRIGDVKELETLKESRRCFGFTLIELLVVISIIALLLSIIVPSLGNAKEAARMMVCKSHLKQISTGANLWSYDNDDWTVAVTWFYYREFSGESGVEGQWPGSIEPYTNAAITSDHEHHNKSAGFKPTLYSCPSLSKKRAQNMLLEIYPDYTQEQLDAEWFLDLPTQQYKAYAANGYALTAYGGEAALGPSSRQRGGGQWDFNGVENGVWKDHGSMKLSNIRSPGSYMSFMDHTGFWVRQDGYDNDWGSTLFYGPDFDQADANTQRLNVWRWHKNNKQANMVFFDGHVGVTPSNFKERTTQMLGGGFVEKKIGKH